MHRRRQHRCRRRFGGVCLETHTQFAHQFFGICQHIHQMRNWCPLIAANIAHAIFQQRLGNRQNPLTGKDVAVAFTQVFHLGLE